MSSGGASRTGPRTGSDRTGSRPEPGTDTALRQLVERIVTGAGYDLDDITVTPAGRRRVVRVIIDSDDGVSLDDAADVSRAISAELDADDADRVLGPQAYTLEVTSRGIGRPLTLPRHYRRARTRLLAVTTTDGRRLTGHVLSASDDAVHLVAGPDGGADLVVPYADIARAAVEVEFRVPSPALQQRLGIVRADAPDDQDDGADERAREEAE